MVSGTDDYNLYQRKERQSCVAASIFDPMEKRTDQQQAIDTAAYTHE